MGSSKPQPSRRSFIAGAAGAAAVALTPGAALAIPSVVVHPPAPAPTMTTTSGAPRALAAHCGVLGPPMADPVVRAEGMQVSVVLTEPADAKCLAWTADDPSVIFESPWVPSAIGTDPTNPVNVVKFFMPEGAGAAGFTWQWQVYVALAGTDPLAPLSAAYGTDDVLRTIPYRPVPGDPTSFSFGVGSCSQIAPPNQANRKIASAVSMAANGLSSFVHLGDTSYVDTWVAITQDTQAQTYTKFATGLRRHFLQPDLSALYDGLPMRVVMDDHEAGPDNCYAANVYPQARQAFTDIAAGTTFDNALYDLTYPTAPGYDTWVVGQTQFWLLDNRLWRDTPGTKPQSFLGTGYASQLGATQRAWLKAGLAASTATIKIICSPRAFKQFYMAPEQQELIDWITGIKSHTPRVSGTVVFLSGYMHAGAVWKLSPTRPVYEMLCGPMFNTTLHSPTGLSSWQTAWGYQTLFLNTAGGLPGRALSNAWGRVDIGADASVTLNLMKDDGTVLYSHTIAA